MSAYAPLLMRFLHKGYMFQIDFFYPGRHGKLIKALTPNQKRMVESSVKNDLL